MVPPGFKKALCAKNIVPTVNFITMAIEYISQLKFADGELVIKSDEKLVIISLKSGLLLFNELITQKHSLMYLSLYKTSQEHLEPFFIYVRAKGGWNNNPTSREFSAAYKRLLVSVEIRDDGIENCITLVSILIGSNRFKNPNLNIFF